jgi:hypothetical protein
VKVGDLVRSIHSVGSKERYGVVVEVGREVISKVEVAVVHWMDGVVHEKVRSHPIVSQGGMILGPEIEVIS